MFLISFPIVAVALVAVVLVVPESRDPHGTPLDPGGAVLSMLTLGLLLFGIIEGPEHGWASPLVVGTLVGAVVAGTLFVRYELRVEHPMLDPRFSGSGRSRCRR